PLPPSSFSATPNPTLNTTLFPYTTLFRSWRSAITSITVDGTTLSTSAYSTTTTGQIIFNPANDALLRSPGTKSIVIAATGYSDEIVRAHVGTGVTGTSSMTTQPGTNSSSV